jgi:hypothetical protein
MANVRSPQESSVGQLEPALGTIDQKYLPSRYPDGVPPPGAPCPYRSDAHTDRDKDNGEPDEESRHVSKPPPSMFRSVRSGIIQCATRARNQVYELRIRNGTFPHSFRRIIIWKCSHRRNGYRAFRDDTGSSLEGGLMSLRGAVEGHGAAESTVAPGPGRFRSCRSRTPGGPESRPRSIRYRAHVEANRP